MVTVQQEDLDAAVASVESVLEESLKVRAEYVGRGTSRSCIAIETSEDLVATIFLAHLADNLGTDLDTLAADLLYGGGQLNDSMGRRGLIYWPALVLDTNTED